MLRSRLYLLLLLFAVYVIIEAAYIFGKRTAPDYPNVKTADLSQVISVKSGRTTYQFFPWTFPAAAPCTPTFWEL